ncbi:hypothetical protein LV457_18805 [Mycobacterium sp. MYCO198283]|uniref:hypothetical protein n=1 Tax=Mycobacterium sp. MYCO198283 TaxID=2883505 RepID=UPI001E46E11E|nr:hypothetical protein [Mycobacterium sp. MYCO198283]MCG5434325.1 hypothetical protein [Mycobacterium sp. MYCO198283]
MEWDDVVDVLCVGAGGGLIAAAIAALDAGLDVVMADGSGDDHPATAEYFAALVEGLAPAGPAGDLTLRVLAEPVAAAPPRRTRRKEAPGTVEPFYGHQLKGWADQCVADDHGVIYSRIANRPMQAATLRSGDTVQASVIGSVTLDGADASSTLTQWMTRHAVERGVRTPVSTRLDRLVFEDSDAVGAVLQTAKGPRAVRVDHGMICGSARGDVDAPYRVPPLTGPLTVQVAVVSRLASRHGRLELLAADEPPLRPRQPVCTASLPRQRHAVA